VSPVPPDLFLVNRDEACTVLKDFLSQASKIAVPLRFDTRYPNQVPTFIAAYITAMDDESRAEIVGRCLVVSGVKSWHAITAQQGLIEHILVAASPLDLSDEGSAQLLQMADKAGHAVIFGGTPGGIPVEWNSKQRSYHSNVALLDPRTYQVQEVLEKAGYGVERARSLAQRCGGNLEYLLRDLRNYPLVPQWAKGSMATTLSIAEVLGSWNEGSESDRLVVESVSGIPYREWINSVREAALFPGTPLSQRDGVWKFLARYEGWFALGPRLFDEHPDKLQVAASLVLREQDPQFELPTDERHTAHIYGNVLSHSRSLRRGLAESLALAGSYPEALINCTIGKPGVTVVLTVRAILGEGGWTLWASLNDVLPLLAEAAPSEFLDAIENTLNLDPCPFDALFAEESNGLFGNNYLTGVLWALEALAWESNYLSRVVMCLGELASRDPGGKWANRPADSLTTILLPWFPQTCAPVAKQRAAVAMLLDEFPDVGWKLALSLLPRYSASSIPTYKPSWRPFIPDDWSEGSTQSEYWEQIAFYTDLVIASAHNNLDKLSELMNHLERFPQPAYETFLKHLDSATILTMPESDRLKLWIEIVNIVTKHRKFPSAEWAMTDQRLDEISVLANKLAPTSPLFRHQRLFSKHEFHMYEKIGDREEQQKTLYERRVAALREILADGGQEAIMIFSSMVESPWRVGFIAGANMGEEFEKKILPNLLVVLNVESTQLAGGFTLGRFTDCGWPWVDQIDTTSWTPEQIGQFLAYLPFNIETWERSARWLGNDESVYWTTTSAISSDAGDGVEYAIDQLIRYGRPHAALDCMSQLLYATEQLDAQRAIAALTAALSSSEPVLSMDPHNIVDIIKVLQNDSGVDDGDLLRIELAYLPLLIQEMDTLAKTLERRMATDASFFSAIFQCLFKSDGDALLDEESLERAKDIATNIYRLLSDWSIPPGSQEDGTYDGIALMSWLDTIRSELSDTKRLAFALTIVGQALVHVPPDPDGLWIHRGAAAALNAKDAGDMRDGFRTELYNSRGAHWGDPTGASKRTFAERYQLQANIVEDAGYHRLATSLRELVEMYKRDAEQFTSRNFLDE